MAAPPKPWERAMGVNQRQPVFNPDQSNAFVTTPTSTSQVLGGGGGGMSGGGGGAAQRPPLPPRPTSYGTVARPSYGYSGGYGGGYGGYGYGGYTSGFGSYGGYSGVGSYGGVGGYGYNRLGPPGALDDGFIQAAEESSRQAFQSIESIVHAFGSVSMMLESTYHAVHSSFRAVLGVAEHFSRMKSHFAQIFSAFAVVRTLKWLYRRLLYLIGLRSQDPRLESAWQSAGPALGMGPLTEQDLKASRSSWPIVMFLAVVFGAPYLIWRLLASLGPAVAVKNEWVKGRGDHYRAVASYAFQAGTQKELSFSAGQQLFLAPKNQQPNVRGWLMASNGERCGLVPANYLKILPRSHQGALQPPTTHQAIGHPSTTHQAISQSSMSNHTLQPAAAINGLNEKSENRIARGIPSMPPSRLASNLPPPSTSSTTPPSSNLSTSPPSSNFPPSTSFSSFPPLSPSPPPDASLIADFVRNEENSLLSNQKSTENYSNQEPNGNTEPSPPRLDDGGTVDCAERDSVHDANIDNAVDGIGYDSSLNSQCGLEDLDKNEGEI